MRVASRPAGPRGDAAILARCFSGRRDLGYPLGAFTSRLVSREPLTLQERGGSMREVPAVLQWPIGLRGLIGALLVVCSFVVCPCAALAQSTPALPSPAQA